LIIAPPPSTESTKQIDWQRVYTAVNPDSRKKAGDDGENRGDDALRCCDRTRIPVRRLPRPPDHPCCPATEGLAREGPWRIGWLDPSMTPTAESPSGAMADFEQRLRELGYVPGRDYVLETRFSDTYWDKLPEMARDLVARGVDVIVTIGTRTVLIAKEATRNRSSWAAPASRLN
jgi:hypothetical protein